MTTTRPFRWESACQTHTGMVRQINEDACLMLPHAGLWLVADGMGGHAAGDLASRIAVEALRDIPPPASLGAFVDEVRRRLEAANTRLLQEAARLAKPTIGATVAVLLAYRNHGVCLWAGDSRIYLYRDRRLRQLTRDHSQVEEMVAEGILSREQAENHPAANIVTRALGGADELELDTGIHELRDNDVFLLCSDGLYKELGDTDIAPLLEGKDIRQTARDLVDLTLHRGARDNVTVVVVRILMTQPPGAASPGPATMTNG
ncbi:MAG TPA: serine/threonine-protein phosphatase [Sedimenticola sp.]|nr:serine/threonine-protein phosphatase [Sedimenticola sp.]